MFGWPDSDWLYIPYQEGAILIRGRAAPLGKIDAKLMNRLVEAAGEMVTIDDMATAGWADRPEPEWLLSEIEHRVTKLRKLLRGGPIQIKSVYERTGRPRRGTLIGWRLEGVRTVARWNVDPIPAGK
jgi:DNA-binding winged helix-turn-helix (wHTH) protein